jgi:hypothetical protein
MACRHRGWRHHSETLAVLSLLLGAQIVISALTD